MIPIRPFSRSAFSLLLLIAALLAALWLAARLEPKPAPENSGLALSPPGGAYDDSLLLKIHASRPGSPVIFSTDGSAPSPTSGTLYERPLRLDGDLPGVTVVRAREIIDGMPGPILSASYSVGVAQSLPILSIIIEPADLQDPDRGLLANTSQRGPEWERPIHVSFIEGDQGGGFEIPAGLRIHDDPAPASKPSLRLYLRQEYGATRLEYPLFPDHQQDIQSYKRLLLQAQDEQRLLRDQLWSEIASEVDGYAAHGRLVWLFVNGEPWGVYRLSERLDRFFLQDNLDISSADLIREGKIEQGDSQHWDALMDWLRTHDLGDPDNYAYLQTQVDVDGLTDYVILQTYFGLSRDDFGAARPRDIDGRWIWLYGEHGLPCGGDACLALQTDQANDLSLLLNKLLENPHYRGRFVGRAADLLNTALSPAAVEARLDQLAAGLQSGGDVERLRQFAQERPEALRRQIMTELGLRDMADLSFSLPAEGGGYLVVNEQPVSTSPWSGTYFVGSELYVIAVPTPGYAFAGWKGSQALASASSFITLTVNGPDAIEPRFTPLRDDDPGLRPNDVIINEYWINDNGTHYASLGGRPIQGDWLELLVTRPRSIDLRGWRITDNDTKTATDEGSIIIPPLEAFAAVPRGTIILVIVTENNANAAQFPLDDLDPSDGHMVLYAGNGRLDLNTDPGFGIGTGNDNLVLLAAGPRAGPGEFADDVGVDFVAEGNAVTPHSFGVLVDGVTFESPFRGLGNDDGVLFTQARDNDNGAIGWRVDPQPYQSGDDARPGATNILTPGALNYRQNVLSLPMGAVGLLLGGLAGAAIIWRLRIRRN